MLDHANFKRSKQISVLISIVFLAVMAVISPVFAQEKVSVKFSYSPNVSAQSVSVAGSFNDWNKAAAPMKEAAGGLWETEIPVMAGAHQYKFVINGEVWVADPANKETCDDGQGGKNSVLNAGADLYKKISSMSPDDNAIDAEGLLHKQADVRYLDFIDDGTVRIMLRSFKNDISSASLVVLKRSSKLYSPSVMTKYASDGIYDYYKTYINDADSTTVYLFFVDSGKNGKHYGYKGAFEPDKSNRMSDNAFKVPDPIFKSVNKSYWWPDAIFYQIFPDRFRDGDAALNQKFVMPWGSKPVNDNFMGGDLAGIKQKLSHLKDLGANAIYLNPIFQSNSNHKYDTIDYFKIDPTLGTEETFKDLLKEAHSKEIKIILDGVFNHTSTDFFAFDDVKKLGEKSRYGAWYNFKSFPVNMQKPNYDCWWNIGSLPKLNIKNTDVYNYLLTIPEYWMRTGIDGFRLDVPNELPHSFWKDFRKIVKKHLKDSYIVGEIWADGSPWLSGDQFDAVMNYKLRNQIISFFVKREITPLKLDEMLSENKTGLSESAFFSMMNMLDSHDTPRFLTVCVGDASVFKSALAFIMCYPGAPSIYYGDEIGLTGEKDPDNRKCMQWNEKEWNKDIYDFYKKIIAVRSENIELRRGDIFTLAAEKDSKIYAFVRVYKNAASVCIFNQDDKNAGEFSIEPGRILRLLNIKRSAIKKIMVSEPVIGKDSEKELGRGSSFKASIPAKGFWIYKFSAVE